MKKFILLDSEPWTKSRYELFFIPFQKIGIDLEIWDLSQVVNKGIKLIDELTESKNVIKISHYQHLNSLLSQSDPATTIFIEEIYRNWQNRKIFKCISNSGHRTIKIDLYGNTMLKGGTLYKIKNSTLKELFVGVLRKISTSKLKFYNKFYSVKQPFLFFSSQRFNEKVVLINHPDVEKYYSTQTKPRLIQSEYIVFCDIFFPYHSDMKYYYNVDLSSEGEKYKSKLIEYFDYIESKYKMPLVIAAHPKADYKIGDFGGREIIKYQTDNLVFYADKVITHLSNSISFSILGNKPILMLSNDAMNTLDSFKYRIKLLCEFNLGIKYFNMDRTLPSEIEFQHIKPDFRQKYIDNYLSNSQINGKLNSDIFKDILNNL